MPRNASGYAAGDLVRVVDGPFKTFEGRIEAVDEVNEQLDVGVTVFGRPAPIKVEPWQIERLD